MTLPPAPFAATADVVVDILLVDDHVANLVALGAVLEPLGQRLVRAHSGPEALVALERADFAVILLDVQMPGMDGFETAVRIKEREASRDTPIIFLTAHHRDEADVFKAYARGAVDYLTKPYAPEVVRAKVSVFVELFRRAAEHRRRDAVERAALLERERASHAAAEAASALKDEFLATVSHELRTPLNAILGWTRMLRAGSVPEDRRDRALETIERNARAQALQVEELLDVSRIITGKLRIGAAPVDLSLVAEAARAAVQPAADARGVQLQPMLGIAGGLVLGDADRLQQIAWNLLSNAVKFTPQGGRVQLTVRETEAHVELVVEDNGRGIGAEFLPHVFEPFRQADGGVARATGGLGLGLTIARRLAELHGGTLSAHSAGEGQGARFVLRVPRPSVD